MPQYRSWPTILAMSALGLLSAALSIPLIVFGIIMLISASRGVIFGLGYFLIFFNGIFCVISLILMLIAAIAECAGRRYYTFSPIIKTILITYGIILGITIFLLPVCIASYAPLIVLSLVICIPVIIIGSWIVIVYNFRQMKTSATAEAIAGVRALSKSAWISLLAVSVVLAVVELLFTVLAVVFF